MTYCGKKFIIERVVALSLFEGITAMVWLERKLPRMRYWILILAIALSRPCFGQEAPQQGLRFTQPDFTSIRAMISDPVGAFYYPTLFSRYETGDTTLSFREYWMLYYGYLFQEQYQPLMFTDDARSMNRLLNQPSLQSSDWETMAGLSRSNLDQNPYDLKGLNLAWISHIHAGDTTRARRYFVKLKKLLEVILSTGDGLSEKTAIHVLDLTHEYDLINILRFEFSGDQTVTPSMADYLLLDANKLKVPGLYFRAGYDGQTELEGAAPRVQAPFPASK